MRKPSRLRLVEGFTLFYGKRFQMQAGSMLTMHSGKYTPPAVPSWLKSLLGASFFVACPIHGDANKNECNQYCLDCAGPALCPSCLVRHKDHHIVQIRRSSYHDVIRVSEIQRKLDITGIQTYVINSARVVFINGRPQPRQGKGVVNNCEICGRSLLDTFRYCSLGCKLAGIKRHKDMTFFPGPDDSEEFFHKKAISKGMNQQFQDNMDVWMAVDGSFPYKGAKQVKLFPRIIDDPNRARLNTEYNPNDANDISPPTPPPSAQRSPKRRKGIPRRAPMGV